MTFCCCVTTGLGLIEGKKIHKNYSEPNGGAIHEREDSELSIRFFKR